jgi:hypothetical protein
MADQFTSAEWAQAMGKVLKGLRRNFPIYEEDLSRELLAGFGDRELDAGLATGGQQ